MFKYKTEAELTAMKAEERETYLTEKRAHEAEQVKNQIADATKDLAKASDVTELSDAVKALKDGAGSPDAPKGSLAHEIKEQKADLKKVLKSAPESDEVELKQTVSKANTLVSSIATNHHLFIDTQISPLARVANGIYNICKKIPFADGNNKGTFGYTDWDAATTANAAAAVAEGVAFPQSTAKFKGYTLSLAKIGDTLPVSDEFFEDEVSAAAELEMFVEANVQDEINKQLINNDGTANDLKGLLASVPAYTPVASGVADANIYDLATLVKTNITKLTGAKFKPDFIAMNEETMNKLVLKKDDSNQYLFPPNHPIYSMIVVENNMPADYMVVGDSRFMRIYEKAGILVSRGTINAQYTEDMITLKAKKRLMFLIKNSDSIGFRKVTDITSALATIATP